MKKQIFSQNFSCHDFQIAKFQRKNAMENARLDHLSWKFGIDFDDLRIYKKLVPQRGSGRIPHQLSKNIRTFVWGGCPELYLMGRCISHGKR
jgi:hypothetical protein